MCCLWWCFLKNAVTDRRFSKNSLFLSIAKKYYRMVTMFFFFLPMGFCQYFVAFFHNTPGVLFDMAFFLARSLDRPTSKPKRLKTKKGGGKLFKGRRLGASNDVSKIRRGDLVFGSFFFKRGLLVEAPNQTKKIGLE